jgi:hypothetical protein
VSIFLNTCIIYQKSKVRGTKAGLIEVIFASILHQNVYPFLQMLIVYIPYVCIMYDILREIKNLNLNLDILKERR